MKDTRIAAVISNSFVGKTTTNLEHMERWVASAAEKKAAIVCFPEMGISGYYINQGIRQIAETIPGPSTNYLARLSRKKNITILAGLAEMDVTEKIFISHVVIKPDGIGGVYRKTHLGPTEKNFVASGNNLPLFKAAGITFGIQLCYDAHFPELSTAMALKGADAVFLPHASPRTPPEQKFQSWMRHLPARAYDNGLFVIACNQCGKNGKGLMFPGVGIVIEPSGEILQSYAGDDEHMIIADLKSDALNNVRSHKMKYFFPNRRPEIY